jgi:hypothetical protein
MVGRALTIGEDHAEVYRSNRPSLSRNEIVDDALRDKRVPRDNAVLVGVQVFLGDLA